MPEDPQATPENPVETPQETPQAPAAPEYVSKAEFARLEAALTNIARAMSQANTPPAPQFAANQPKTMEDLSDADLFSMAQQGNPEAFRAWNARISRQEIKQELSYERKKRAVEDQIKELAKLHPDLMNQSSELHQATLQFHNALVMGGWGSQNDPQTYLDAALRAVAASRSKQPTQPARGGAPIHTSVMHRAPDAQPDSQTKVSPEEYALAKKMNVKDPNKAIKKFWERQESGQSVVSPLIAAEIERRQR